MQETYQKRVDGLQEQVTLLQQRYCMIIRSRISQIIL